CGQANGSATRLQRSQLTRARFSPPLRPRNNRRPEPIPLLEPSPAESIASIRLNSDSSIRKKTLCRCSETDGLASSDPRVSLLCVLIVFRPLPLSVVTAHFDLISVQ